MAKAHPDEKTLQKFGAGKLNRRENLKVSWHLFNCASCRQELERLTPEGTTLLSSLFQGLEPLEAPDDPSYDRAFTFGRNTLEVRGEARDRDRLRAPKLFAELARHPVSRRRSLIERTWRFKNYVFGEYLLEESAGNLETNPALAEDLGELALSVAEQLKGSHYGAALLNDLKARSWAAMGSARRMLGAEASAEEAFAQVELCLADGTGDVLLKAKFLSLKGEVRRKQKSFREAAELLNEALRLFREAGEDQWADQTQASRVRLAEESGEPLLKVG